MSILQVSKLFSHLSIITKLQQETIENADQYSKEMAAEASKLLFTSEYVRLETANALSTNTKFYFSGETSPLGSLLSKLINQVIN